MSLIDTYQIATGGQNSLDTFTLASNGILVRIAITPIPPTPTPTPGRGGSSDYGLPKRKEKEKKKITVWVTIDGIEYTESIIVKDKPNLKVEDVKVDVTPTSDRPKITISL